MASANVREFHPLFATGSRRYGRRPARGQPGSTSQRLGVAATLYCISRWLGRFGAGAGPESQALSLDGHYHYSCLSSLLRYRVSLRSMVEPSPPEAFFRSIGGHRNRQAWRVSIQPPARRRGGRAPLPLLPSNPQIEWREVWILYPPSSRPRDAPMGRPSAPITITRQGTPIGTRARTAGSRWGWGRARDVLGTELGRPGVRRFGGSSVTSATEFESEAEPAPPT